jgi:large subunit ribosomal protein L6
MSRVGFKPIPLPAGAKVSLQNATLLVEGKQGKLQFNFPKTLTLKTETNQVLLERINDAVETKKVHGTTRAIVANAVVGVTQGFKEELELVGIGFRAVIKANKLVLTVGYSHEVVITPLPGVKITVNENTKLVVEGIDKQAVGQVAASIRDVRKPEPYQGKGIRYKGERIIRKEGKRAAAAAAPAAGGAKK